MKALKNTKKNKEDESVHWEELENIYVSVANGLLETAKSIALIVKNKDLVDNVPDKSKFNLSCNGFFRDSKLLAEELATIHKKHIDKSGEITNGDDLVNNLIIGSEYFDFISKYEGLIPPMAFYIGEQADAAKNIINKNIDLPINNTPVITH